VNSIEIKEEDLLIGENLLDCEVAGCRRELHFTLVLMAEKFGTKASPVIAWLPR
jgi:hypothetical protein